jgi:hypothetical protein
VAGDTLVILGRNLRGEVTRVLVAGAEVVPTGVSGERVTAPLSAPPIPSDLLRAGVQGVQVIHRLLMGTPPVEHRGFESNVVAFVLHPTITKDAADNYEVGISGVLPDTGGTRQGLVTVMLDPLVGTRQRVVLLLNERDPAAPPAHAYSFEAQPRAADTDQVEFQIRRVMPAAYLVRVQVDGAETGLEIDSVTNRYTLPALVIP